MSEPGSMLAHRGSSLLTAHRSLLPLWPSSLIFPRNRHSRSGFHHAKTVGLRHSRSDC